MEWKRVLLGKAFLSALALLVILNTFFFYYQHGGSYGQFGAEAASYVQNVDELSGLSWEAGAAACEDYLESVSQSIRDGTWDGGDMYRSNVIRSIEPQFLYLISYGPYLDRIEADAEKLQGVSLFADPDSFGYKNAVKTAEDFASMRGAAVTFGHDMAVTDVFADRWADYSILLLAVVICAVFMAERRAGLWPVIYAAPCGRVRLAVRRIGILLAGSVIGTAAVLGPKILLSAWLYGGLDEWGRLLQSIPVFQNAPLPLTIGQFWMLYLAVKAAGTFFIGLALWAVMSMVADLGLALCGAGLLLAVEYACTAIPSASAFAILRYCNLFSYVDYIQVFQRYLNLSIFGALISGSDLVLALLPALCAAVSGVCLAAARFKRPVSPVNRLLRFADRLRRRIDPYTARGRLLALEAEKLLIRRKGLLVLAVLVLVLTRAEAPERRYDPLDMYDQYYEQLYAGPITEDTLASLEAELTACTGGDRAGSLTRLVGKLSQAPEGAWLIPSGPYDAVWSQDDAGRHGTNALLALLVLTLLLSPIAAQENEAQVRPLLFAAPGGRKKLWRRKAVLAALLSALVWAMVYGAEMLLIVRANGPLTCLSAPTSSLGLSCNMVTFQGSRSAVPICATLAQHYGLRLMVLLAVGQLCLFISGLSRRSRDAMLACVGLIVVPAALAGIGSDALARLSFLLPLESVPVFFRPGPFIAAAIAGAAAAAMARHWQTARQPDKVTEKSR